MINGKKVLITGGLGFIGSNLARALVKIGAKVTIYDNFMEKTGSNFYNIEDIKDRIEFISGDIRDKEKIEEAVKEKDIIFNLAGQVSHVLSMENPFLDIDINCKGQLIFLEACRKNNPEAKIIYSGSRTQVGSVGESTMNENSQQNPTDIYAAGSMAGELYHLIYNKVYGLKTSCIRLTNTYGEGAQITNPKYGVLNWFIGRAVLDEEITIFEPGTQLRDINYVGDVVGALILAAENERAIGEVFMLGSGVGIPLLNIAQEIIKAAKSGKIKFVPWTAERKNIEAGDVIVDYSKAKRILGWAPKTSIEDGLKKTIGFYKKNLDNYYPEENTRNIPKEFGTELDGGR